MNAKAARRLLVASMLCLQLGTAPHAPGLLDALQGSAPTTAVPHCAHELAGARRANRSSCCVEAGCRCACLVARVAPASTGT